MLPKLANRPPTTTVGSSPASDNTAATREVVVVLPWAPATATEYFIRISSASISARGITGIRRRSASTTSGLSPATAEEITTTAASPTFSKQWPTVTLAPRPRRRSTAGESRRSEPDTR